KEVLQPGTFHFTGDSPAGITDFMTSLTEGLMESSEIMFGIIMIGGMFAVIEESGLIDIGVYKLTNLFSNKVLWVIPTIMIPLALFTSFTGQAEMMLVRSEEHTSELQSRFDLVCRLLLEKKNLIYLIIII